MYSDWLKILNSQSKCFKNERKIKLSQNLIIGTGLEANVINKY